MTAGPAALSNKNKYELLDDLSEIEVFSRFSHAWYDRTSNDSKYALHTTKAKSLIESILYGPSLLGEYNPSLIPFIESRAHNHQLGAFGSFSF